MTSRHPKGERRERDAYYTPDLLASACVHALIADGFLYEHHRVWEPHAGGGAYVRALTARGLDVTATDANPAIEWGCVDFLDAYLRPDWIIGNPPYCDAERHARHALQQAQIGVAFLLRLGFLESQKRAPFWREHPPARVYVLHRRPSFTGGGTDGAAYAWFVWMHRHTGDPSLGWLDW